MKPQNDTYSYDIFSGAPESQPMWMERVTGRAAAIERMHSIAQQSPGTYFCFGGEPRRVVAIADTRKSGSRGHDVN